MSGLVSILVGELHPLVGVLPLHAIPGWPVFEHPSLLAELGLFVGVPVALLLVILLLGNASRLAARGRGEELPQFDHPAEIYGLEEKPAVEAAAPRNAIES